MKIFKKIKSYPGSDEHPEILKSTNSFYYAIKPEIYPDLYQEVEEKDILKIVTEDGKPISFGDIVYIIINNKVTKIIYNRIIESPIFSSSEAAFNYQLSKIDINTEDGPVKGEYCILYGVLNKADWQLTETDSLKVEFRKNITSPNWKYFKTKESREEYIKWNKPIYSLLDIKNKNYDL